MIQKLIYEQPFSELFVVRIEGNFMQSNVTPGAPGGDEEYNDQGDF